MPFLMTADVFVDCGAVAVTVEGATALDAGSLVGLVLAVLVGVVVGLDVEVEDAGREEEGPVVGLPKPGLKQQEKVG